MGLFFMFNMWQGNRLDGAGNSDKLPVAFFAGKVQKEQPTRSCPYQVPFPLVPAPRAQSQCYFGWYVSTTTPEERA